MRRVEYQCCYCGEGIESGADRRHALDPCAVVLIGNWQAPEPEQLSQQFFSHFECFRRHLSDPSYVEMGIASYEEMKARTMEAARGTRRIAADEPKVWFTSTESIAKVLSTGNRELLQVIAGDDRARP